LPFKDSTFDSVCINGVLHHIVDLERAIRELARVTKGSVYISEGIPRGAPSLRRMLSYPGLSRKMVYCSYWLACLAYKIYTKSKSKMRKIVHKLFHHAYEYASKSHGSEYERPLDAKVVQSIFEANGFKKVRLRYYTNLDFPGDGFFKRKATNILVNNMFGTHFDLRMDHVGDKSQNHELK
jgi:ubiquinone/menaquinone biosynthesis C-methylase UbiE